MPWAFKKHPVTGDRIPNGRGGFEKTFTAENLVRNQVLAHAGRVWQDPRLGSNLHDRERFSANPELLTKADLELSLGRVVSAGRIADLEVEVVKGKVPGRVEGGTRFVDTSAGQLVSTKLPIGG